jgi:hypothetical protein
MRWLRRSPALIAALLIAGIAAVGSTSATFGSQTSSTSNRVSAAPDFRAPTASSSLIFKSQTPGSSTGYIKQGGTYRVYANVADTGNPASGTATVTANVSAFSTGVTAAPLTAGSFTVAGVTYNYRSAILTASSPVSEGSKSFTLGLADNAANSGTASGFSVIVDNTAPSATNIQTVSGGTLGTPTSGDQMVYTFGEPIDPDTIKSGWTGASTAVDVIILDGGGGLLGLGGLLGAADDVLTVEPDGGGTRLPLNVGLGSDNYAWDVVLVLRVTCHVTFNNSTMVMSANTITVTLGGSPSCNHSEGSSATLTYVPTAGPTDRAGNALPTTALNETGTADRDF